MNKQYLLKMLVVSFKSCALKEIASLFFTIFCFAIIIKIVSWIVLKKLCLAFIDLEACIETTTFTEFLLYRLF